MMNELSQVQAFMVCIIIGLCSVITIGYALYVDNLVDSFCENLGYRFSNYKFFSDTFSCWSNANTNVTQWLTVEFSQLSNQEAKG